AEIYDECLHLSEDIKIINTLGKESDFLYLGQYATGGLIGKTVG
ncbi:unnamed protein product, partial [marine sediment metagenome]